MIVVGLSGGLGNQLQQYALYTKYVSLGVDARVDVSWFDEEIQCTVAARRGIELDSLPGVEYRKCSEKERELFISRGIWGKIVRRLGLDKAKYYTENNIYDPELLKLTDRYLDGAFTCECYYADILPELRKKIRFPIEKYSKRADLDSIAQDIARKYSIAMHIRRGDYLDDINMPIYGNICTKDYYLAALDVGLENIKEAKLFVFSDDPKYAAEFASELVAGHDNLLEFEAVNINSGSNSLFDMYLMSLCDCVITANSTFSYWGARLNGKDNVIKIRPTKHKNSQPFMPEEMLKLWHGWVFVSPEGNVYRKE